MRTMNSKLRGCLEILCYLPVIVDGGIYTSSTVYNLENKQLISELVISLDIPLTNIRTIKNCYQIIIYQYIYFSL